MDMVKIRSSVCAALVTLSFASAGCGPVGTADLQEFMRQTGSQVSRHVEPIPQFQPPGAVEYLAADGRDPFKPVEVAAATAPEKAVRIKEPLESYPMDSLKMMGSVARSGSRHAIVKAPDGTLHTVSAGNHLGESGGLITEVTETEIRLTENARDPGDPSRTVQISLSAEPR